MTIATGRLLSTPTVSQQYAAQHLIQLDDAHLDIYNAFVALHLQIVKHELREHHPRAQVERVVEQKLQQKESHES